MSFYTTSQATKILNISRPTLYKLCKSRNIKPQQTIGGNYRFSEYDIKKLLNKDEQQINLEKQFVNIVNDIWFILRKFADDIWGLKEGEKRLIEILRKNQDEIFILNMSNFKEK